MARIAVPVRSSARWVRFSASRVRTIDSLTLVLLATRGDNSISLVSEFKNLPSRYCYGHQNNSCCYSLLLSFSNRFAFSGPTSFLIFRRASGKSLLSSNLSSSLLTAGDRSRASFLIRSFRSLSKSSGPSKLNFPNSLKLAIRSYLTFLLSNTISQ
jgi:hypothetical protein